MKRTLSSILLLIPTLYSTAQQLNYSYDGSNGAAGLVNYGIVTQANAGQATLGAEGNGDLYANLNLGTNISGTRRFWHISKRNSGEGHSLQFYYFNGSTFQYPVVTMSPNGNVGIGTVNPGAKLEVNGDINLPSVTGNKQIYTWNASDANWRIGMSPSPGFTRSMATSHVEYLTYSFGPGQGFAVGVNGGESSFEVTGSNHNAFFRGNVGIGTTDISDKLNVNGKIRSEEVKVVVDVAGDYVFEKDYSLPSLDEVQKYITEHKHLPGIPSAKELKENYWHVGDMSNKMLVKIEELTLYILEQNQKILDQQQKIMVLEEKVAELEKIK